MGNAYNRPYVKLGKQWPENMRNAFFGPYTESTTYPLPYQDFSAAWDLCDVPVGYGPVDNFWNCHFLQIGNGFLSQEIEGLDE